MSGDAAFTLSFYLDDLEIDEEAGVARCVMTLDELRGWVPMLQAALSGLAPMSVGVAGGEE